MLDVFSFQSIFSRRLQVHSVKKAYWFCFYLFFFGLLFSLNAQAQTKKIISINQDNLGLPVEYTAPTSGHGILSPINFSITLNDITGDGVLSFQFDVLYDPAIINPVGPNFGCSTTGTIAGAAGTIVLCNVTTPGTLKLSSIGFAPMTGMGSLVNMTFMATPTAMPGDMSPLTFANGFFFDSMGLVASNPNAGQITLLGPTAANTILSGRVTATGGRSINNAVVILIDLEGNMRMSTSNSFGYYRFDEVQSGESYTISVFSKGYTFTPQFINVEDSITDFDLIAEP